LVPFKVGDNTLRAVAVGSAAVTDEIRLIYQTESWGKPAKFMLAEVGRDHDTVTIEARVFDKNGVPCLDAANLVEFGLTGDGRLMDNLGTATGSRIVQLANGRARISLDLSGSTVVASISSDGIETGFTTIKAFDVAAIDRARILKAAETARVRPPISITRHHAKLSEGGPNDFYSNGDYWWPDPAKPDGLPYIQRDGQTNPDNFNQHRMAIRDLRDAVAALAAAYKITGDARHVTKAADLLRVFFLDPATRMNPHLNYAQAIPGRTPGRGIGIIDTLHLIEIPVAIAVMSESPALPPEVAAGMKEWFAAYLDWMITSKNGREEAAAKNNHSVAYWLQAAVFARFTGDEKRLAECRRQFTEVFIPEQMAADGSFPAELARTKPYAYSIFQLDNMVTLCQMLSTPANDLWAFELPDGRSIRKAVAFLFPFLADKSKWPRKPDVQAWEGWPARQPALVFSGLAYGEKDYLDLWRKLPPDPADPEVQRNIAITQPVLWLK
jgi:hypothetical protein